MPTMISDTMRTLALASMRRARGTDAPGRTRPRASIMTDGARVAIDSLNGAAAPLDCTRYIFNTHHARGPVLSSRTLCVTCASVAFRTSSRTIRVGNVARRVSTFRTSVSVVTSGVACDACGHSDLPYGERLVHDPPDRLV